MTTTSGPIPNIIVSSNTPALQIKPVPALSKSGAKKSKSKSGDKNKKKNQDAPIFLRSESWPVLIDYSNTFVSLSRNIPHGRLM